MNQQTLASALQSQLPQQLIDALLGRSGTGILHQITPHLDLRRGQAAVGVMVLLDPDDGPSVAHTARPRLGTPLLLPGAAEPVGRGETSARAAGAAPGCAARGTRGWRSCSSPQSGRGNRDPVAREAARRRRWDRCRRETGQGSTAAPGWAHDACRSPGLGRSWLWDREHRDSQAYLRDDRTRLIFYLFFPIFSGVSLFSLSS